MKDVSAVPYQQYLDGLILFLFAQELCHARPGCAQNQGTNISCLDLQIFYSFFRSWLLDDLPIVYVAPNVEQYFEYSHGDLIDGVFPV